MQDRLIMNQEAGRDVREAEDFWHDQKENRPKPVVDKFKREPKVSVSFHQIKHQILLYELSKAFLHTCLSSVALYEIF